MTTSSDGGGAATSVRRPPGVDHAYVEANGFELHYVVGGEGPPIVLLHGDSASAVDWKWVLPALTGKGRVFAVDLPGHGDSAKPPAPYSPALFTETVIAFLDALGIDRAVLVGHSLGGLIASRAALRLRDRVRSLCLVASGGLGRYVHPFLAAQTWPGVGEASAAVGRTPLGRHQRAMARALLLYARWWRAPSVWLAEQRRLMTLPGFPEASLRTRRSAIDAWGQKDLVLPELRDLEVPTLVVWGANDVVLPASHAHAATAALPDARLEILPGCGHMPHIECSAAFAEALTRFLDEHQPT